MNKIRNPFRMRASEKIESDENFLRLYSPITIEGLIALHEVGSLWDKILFIHSSPGAGKTSLLRVFEPQSLLTILSRSSKEHSELHEILNKLEIFESDKVKLLGVMKTFTRNYEYLEDLDVSRIQKKRIFFSLINSRLILSTLKTILDFKKLTFPDDLKRIKFTYHNSYNYLKNIDVPCTGVELYNWALNIERDVYEALDSFLPVEKSIEGHDELFAFEILNPTFLKIDENDICEKFLFMLDDVHKLSIIQREALTKFLIEKRIKANIWISERTEALKPEENLGTHRQRDFEELNIEKFYQNKPSRFEKIVSNISYKRAQLSSENVNAFEVYLENILNSETVNLSLTKTLERYTILLSQLKQENPKYEEWIDSVLNFHGDNYDKVINMKTCEILIHRDLNKPQLELDLGFALSYEEFLDLKNKNNVLDAARFFIAQEQKLPTYYGFDNLVKLSNYNIEQFLSFAVDLFEEILSKNIADQKLNLSPEIQEKIFKRIVNSKWNELQRVIPNSKFVINLLTNLSSFARNETYKKSAPIVQGVTGFAITNIKTESFFESSSWKDKEEYKPLVNTLSTCVAYNLLEPRIINQGGKINQVFYFNRWLCVKFNLPLSHGGWKNIKPLQLLRWLKGM